MFLTLRTFAIRHYPVRSGKYLGRKFY